MTNPNNNKTLLGMPSDVQAILKKLKDDEDRAKKLKDDEARAQLQHQTVVQAPVEPTQPADFTRTQYGNPYEAGRTAAPPPQLPPQRAFQPPVPQQKPQQQPAQPQPPARAAQPGAQANLGRTIVGMVPFDAAQLAAAQARSESTRPPLPAREPSVVVKQVPVQVSRPAAPESQVVRQVVVSQPAMPAPAAQQAAPPPYGTREPVGAPSLLQTHADQPPAAARSAPAYQPPPSAAAPAYQPPPLPEPTARAVVAPPLPSIAAPPLASASLPPVAAAQAPIPRAATAASLPAAAPPSEKDAAPPAAAAASHEPARPRSAVMDATRLGSFETPGQGQAAQAHTVAAGNSTALNERPRLSLPNAPYQTQTGRAAAATPKRWPALLLIGLAVIAAGVVVVLRAPHLLPPPLAALLGREEPTSEGDTELGATGLDDQAAATERVGQVDPAQPDTTATAVSAATDPQVQPIAAAPGAVPSAPAVAVGEAAAALEKQAIDRLAVNDYPGATRAYQQLRAADPTRREYTVMLELLARASAAPCGQPGQEPCAQ